MNPQEVATLLSHTEVQWAISSLMGFIVFVIIMGIARLLKIQCGFLIYAIAFGVACYFIFLTLTGLHYIVDWNSLTPFPAYTHELNS